ncbi:hypothetical protein ACTXT7_016572 [Hymenolepis weldensis]
MLLIKTSDKNHARMKKIIQEMISGSALADPTEVLTVMHAYEVSSNSDVVSSKGHVVTPHIYPQDFRVNADTDAYVETLQTIF